MQVKGVSEVVARNKYFTLNRDILPSLNLSQSPKIRFDHKIPDIHGLDQKLILIQKFCEDILKNRKKNICTPPYFTKMRACVICVSSKLKYSKWSPSVHMLETGFHCSFAKDV